MLFTTKRGRCVADPNPNSRFTCSLSTYVPIYSICTYSQIGSELSESESIFFNSRTIQLLKSTMSSSSITDPEISVGPILSGTSLSFVGRESDEKASMATDDLSVDTSAFRYSLHPIAAAPNSGNVPDFLGTSHSFTKFKHLVRILEEFHVDLDVPPLYLSPTQVIVSAWDISHKEPVTLTFLNDADRFRTELLSRVDVDTDHILQVRKAFVDSTVFQAPPQSNKTIMEPMDKLTEEVSEYLTQLTKRTVHQTDSSSSASPKAADFNFAYVLCLETYDTTLAQFIAHNSMIDMSDVRSIVRDIVTGLISLHSENRIHGKLNPKTIVRVGSIWKLKDLDISRTIGEECDCTHLDMAHSPPELAYTWMNTSIKSDLVYLADTSYDLWSLGCVIFFCIKGSPLWNCDANGNISLLDLKHLAHWSPQEFLDQAQLYLTPENRGDDERAVLDLLSRLLMPTPQDRKAFFPFGYVFTVQGYRLIFFFSSLVIHFPGSCIQCS
jgi:hypothetical protein